MIIDSIYKLTVQDIEVLRSYRQDLLDNDRTLKRSKHRLALVSVIGQMVLESSSKEHRAFLIQDGRSKLNGIYYIHLGIYKTREGWTEIAIYDINAHRVIVYDKCTYWKRQ